MQNDTNDEATFEKQAATEDGELRAKVASKDAIFASWLGHASDAGVAGRVRGEACCKELQGLRPLQAR